MKNVPDGIKSCVIPSVVDIFIVAGDAVACGVGVGGISVAITASVAVACCGTLVAVISGTAVSVDWQAARKKVSRGMMVFFCMLLNQFHGVACLIFKKVRVDAVCFLPGFERSAVIAFTVETIAVPEPYFFRHFSNAACVVG